MKNVTKTAKSPEKRSRRTLAELFLDQLSKLSGGSSQLVSNNALRDALGWDEEKYARIKNQLLEERQIFTGRGHGGTVALTHKTGNEKLKVFISYSHVDEGLKAQLVKHLEPLTRIGLIQQWSDRQIMPGADWASEINQKLDSADIVLLLVSSDFINSDYCYDVELDRALELHAKGACRVIPVILRPCMWKATRFANLQALPLDAKAITTWPTLDEGILDAAERIREQAIEMLASRVSR